MKIKKMGKKIFLINSVICIGITSAMLGCSNEMENSDIYSDKEFHAEVVQLQNKYNSSLKIDESILDKDDETLTNINDILRTIENSCFEYELISSENGGLIAMPILTTTATRSNSAEATPMRYSEVLSHELLPCQIVITCEGQKFSIKSRSGLYELTNISCRGSVTAAYVDVSGDFKMRLIGSSTYTTYSIYRRKSEYENEFRILKRD